MIRSNRIVNDNYNNNSGIPSSSTLLAIKRCTLIGNKPFRYLTILIS